MEDTRGGPRKFSDFDQRFFDEVKHDIEQGRKRAAHIVPNTEPVASNEEELDRRLDLYLTTGNRGYLIDLARYAMWAWIEAE